MAVRAGASPSEPSQTSVTRPLNTAFQINTSRPAFVAYGVQMTVTASIASGQDGQVVLEIAGDQAFTQNVQTVMMAPGSQAYTLAVALQGVQKSPGSVFGMVPAGMWARIRTVNLVGTPGFTFMSGQEVLM